MRRILFVCVSNSCRSQMAEAFLNSLGKGRAEARSAGSRPASKIDAGARRAMMEAGIPLPRTRPKLLTPELLDWADTVITMGCKGACPRTDKPTADWGIPDPVGKPMAEYRRVREEIRRKVLGLLAH